MAIYNDTSVQYLKGVGPKMADILRKRSITTVGELLYWIPRSYEDRRAARKISSLKPGETVSLVATIFKVHSFSVRGGRRIYEVLLMDSSGKIACKYFRIPYKGYFEKFHSYQKVRVSGKIISYKNQIQFQHPDIHVFNPDEEPEDALIPLYTETEGLSSKRLRQIIGTAIEVLINNPQDDRKYEGDKRIPGVPEKLPHGLLTKYNLLSLPEALKQIHLPPAYNSKEYLSFKAPAQRRIIFEELFWLELHLAMKKSGIQKKTTFAMGKESPRIHQLIQSLSFDLTRAQERAFKEIREDLKQPHPMHRIVQGDVGSGKTIVALLAIAHGADNGFQSALMAPTEILAEQHYKNAKKLLEPLGLQVGLLSGQIKEKNKILESLNQDHMDLCVGTHALIQESVEFRNLGLVIIDEQHRFGVDQRNRLWSKGKSPHLLVMTATPIPRTLAMTIYGDLDVSVIDELPAGRTPIVTRVVNESKRQKVMGFVCDQIRKGRQVYIIYPLVEESEKIDLKNAVSEFEKLQAQFSEFKVGLLHGKMKSAEKDRVMNLFCNREIDLLVSTTVVEVGVDVPNANLIIIEHAERFGLSQLHQLRGRVGRGPYKSYCVLMLGYAVSDESQMRTQILESTTDGFKIAEADLEMRGPGEFLGTRQSGILNFKMANLTRDVSVLQDARQAAFEIVKKDPNLSHEDHQALREELARQMIYRTG